MLITGHHITQRNLVFTLVKNLILASLRGIFYQWKRGNISIWPLARLCLMYLEGDGAGCDQYKYEHCRFAKDSLPTFYSGEWAERASVKLLHLGSFPEVL